MDATATNLIESNYPELKIFSDDILSVEDFRGDFCFSIKSESTLKIIEHLKTKLQFDMMMDLFGMDYLKYSTELPERFAVVYILYSTKTNKHIRIKSYLSEDNPEIDSLCDTYKAANWFEREAWDLFGIKFKGHPNLVRILCHNDFEGHPLRKDYPADKYQRLKSPASPQEF